VCQGFAEYGDRYTPMGSGCGHFNALESGALGFISGCNTLTVTSSGTFDIGPIEAKCSGPQVIRIAANAKLNFGPQYIYVEYRRGAGSVGSDTRSPQGIYFHASAEYGGNATGIDSGDRHNLDYALDPFDIHVPLTTVGSTWTEPSSGATFELTAMGETATVEVTIPDGGGHAATCIDGALPPPFPMCSTIVIDAGTSDGGEAGVEPDAAPDAVDAGDAVDARAGRDAAATGGSIFISLPEDPGDDGCSCRFAVGPASTRTPLAWLGLAALLAARRRSAMGERDSFA
jgi:hypothetical protein